MSRKAWWAAAGLTLVAIGAVWGIREWRSAFRTVADSDYRPAPRASLFPGSRPVLLFDQAHRNHHKADGTYRPFVRLAESVGVTVQPLPHTATAEHLKGARALMIVAAQGPEDPGDQPAFTPAEISAIRDFVSAGGGLILVVDHYPFADAAQGLANAFGVELSRGMTFDVDHSDKAADDESQLVFSRANGLLATHPLTEKVESVVLFTGVSVSAPPNAVKLLATGANAKDMLPTVRVVQDGGDRRTIIDYTASRPAAGRAMGIAFAFGRGRVVVLGDVAMLTAQYDRRTQQRFGLSMRAFDNEQFVVNLLRWTITP